MWKICPKLFAVPWRLFGTLELYVFRKHDLFVIFSTANFCEQICWKVFDCVMQTCTFRFIRITFMKSRVKIRHVFKIFYKDTNCIFVVFFPLIEMFLIYKVVWNRYIKFFSSFPWSMSVKTNLWASWHFFKTSRI